MVHTTAPAQATADANPRFVLDRKTLIAASIGIGVAQVGLAMPAVLNGLFQEDLGTTASQLTWISDAFLVPVTLFELTFGVLGDLFGRKRLLIIGTALLALGSFIVLLTPTSLSVDNGTKVLILWGGQIIAGIGAAAVMPTTLAMVAAGTHTPRDRARAISVWAAALATGSFVAPVLGGFFAQFAFGSDEFASWHWAFLMLMVLAVFSTIVTATIATNSSAPIGRSLDWPGQITIAIAFFGLLYGVIQGTTSGFGSPDVVLGFVLAVVGFIVFIVVERRSTAPLLRLDLFSIRSFAVGSIATVLGMFAYLGTAYTTSIRLSSIQGYSPLFTSIAFVLLNVAALLFARPIANLMEHYNPRWIMAAGFGLIGVGDLWASLVPASTMSLWLIAVPIFLVGCGFALSLHAITGVAVNTVPNHLAGMASSTTSLLRDFGFTLGPAVIGSIALSRAAGEIQSTIAGNPTLAKNLAAFYASADNASAAQKPALEAAIGAVKSSPLGANAIPGNPLKDVAFTALDHAYSFGYLVCAIAAILGALLAAVLLGGAARNTQIAEDSLHE